MTLTKIQIVFHLIQKGATLEELMNATGSKMEYQNDTINWN
jgi:hypothetical protein